MQFFYLSLDEDFLMLSIVKIHNEIIFIYSLFVPTVSFRENNSAVELVKTEFRNTTIFFLSLKLDSKSEIIILRYIFLPSTAGIHVCTKLNSIKFFIFNQRKLQYFIILILF